MSGSLAVESQGHESARNTRGTTEAGEQAGGSTVREMPAPSSSGVSYAVAIYPYMAEQDDEFDVVV